MTAKIDWHPIRALARRVLEQGQPLELTDDMRALLRRSAQEVAIPSEDAEKALRGLRTAKALLRKISKRIGGGSDRLGRARSRAYRLQDAGDLDGACKQLEGFLAVEVVPFYRQQAENHLKEVLRLKAVAESGRVDPTLPERSQIPILLHRVWQGKALELNDEMRLFLRRAAETVAISEAETEEALANPDKAGALLGMSMKRLREGSRRLERALERMMSLRDVGDFEGARQQMRDVLAVEIVPMFRRAAEENLASLDEPPRAP
jgi:DUSAM domain-containing protein